MATNFIVSRKGTQNFDKMIAMWKWCTATFGERNWPVSWDGDFADDTDNWVSFNFYDERLAPMFKLKFSEAMSQSEFDQYKIDHSAYDNI